ncbi:hypothetical protein AB4Z46_31525 [Variovorax sp. M-6]|uniref:hypothetical protein n=1 Tax=Variovorax sp. M-6 TaxID=3233041 RepID=UPI003F97C426
MRILLGEVEPLVARIAEIAALLDSARGGLKSDLEEFSGKVEKAMIDGTARAAGTLCLNFQSTIGEQGNKLLANGRHAAAEVGVQINTSAAEFIAAADTLDRKVLRLLLVTSSLALLAGIAGGGLMYWLLVM